MADRHLRENATGVVSMLVTAIWMGALFTGQEWWLAALLVGYIGVVPLTGILFGDEEVREQWAEHGAPKQSSTDEEDDALETLRQRYARGDLTEEQFERKLEQLLETETREDAAERVRSRPSVESEDERDTELYER